MTDTEKMICKKFKLKKTPESIDITEMDGKVKLALDPTKVFEANMQDTGNSFEGWAIVAYISSNYSDVILDVNEDKKYCLSDYKGEYVKHGHWSRFLYRAMRFSEQYDEWFKLSEELQDIVNDFRVFLTKKDKPFVNNAPTKEAEETDRIADENNVEAKLATGSTLQDILSDSIDIGGGKVYRQLPVGLFHGEKGRDTAVFTNGHSAIDLWKINGDIINVIELKTHNRMIGIITEIFFYSNYMLDLVCKDGIFTLAKGGNERGYEELKPGLSGVNGIMLADDDKEGGFHPCVDDKDEEVINVLNKNGKDNLNYYKAKYHFNSSVDVSKAKNF